MLGYTLTFRGVDKPTPTARDAMLVEVKDAGGRTYTARPKMFRNEKSNQLVANPDVKVRLTHDLYIAPIEFDPGRAAESGAVIELGKGETGTIGPFAITFRGFDMGGAHGDGEAMSVGALLTVAAGGTTREVKPTLSSGSQGLQPQPAALPGGAGATVSIAGLNANAGRVRLEVSGVSSGIAKRASVRQGETLTYRGVTLTFDDFDLSDFDPQEGRINLGAVLKVGGGQAGAAAGEITAYYRSDGTSEQHVDAAVPGLDGVTVRVGRMDPNEKSVEILVLDASARPDPGDPARFSADFTVKPMIGLLWLGLVVLLAGGIVAVARRTEEFAAPVTATSAAGK